MSRTPSSSGDDVLAGLRRAIRAIESTSADLVRPTQSAAQSAARSPRASAPAPLSYVGMPEGSDWMHNLPVWYRHGEGGFDRRIMEELASVGVRCYTLDDLTRARSVPQGIPVFIDWLTHLEERIPGPESEHRRIIRCNLIRNLNDAAARGNQHAIEVLIAQLRRQPTLVGAAPDYAAFALARIATRRDCGRIVPLLDELPPEMPKGPLIEYLGKVKTDQARDIALRYLDTEWTYFSLKALIAMKASVERTRIEPYLTDANNAFVRRYARKVLRTLTE